MSDDHLIQKYYEAEMRYLREAGKEFAQAYPDRARYLNLDRVGDRDPYVERLFEGFAFLTGRVRQKLDDELPELTEGLVSMLWPHYLRMIPSLAILELTPDASDIQKAEEIPAGLAVRSSPVGPTGAQCLYRTTQSVNVQPISLIEASANTQADGRSVLRMRFELSPQARRVDLDLSRIRLYLDADTPVVSALYLALSQHVQSSQCRIAEVAGGAAQRLSGIHFESVGFSQQEKLWPSADQAFSGYQLLLEYFTFPEKFRFLDLCGFSIDSIPAGSRQFDLEFVLKQSYPNDLAFSAQNIRLFCTPIINLFSLESDPLRVSHLETEYRVVPMAQHGGHVETYSVDEVISLDQISGLRNDYVPFSSFKHRGGMMRHDAPERYFHTRTRKGASGMNETWLSLGGHLWESLDKLPAETLSLRVTGTHGQLPRKALRDSSINTLMGSANKVKSVRNLTSPTMPCYPPVGDRFQWRVLSHLAPNYLSLLDAEILRGTLALYDWTDNELNRRRIEGVSHVQFSEIQKMSRGGLIYGVAIEVTLQSSHFTGEGDVFLFGELLQHFFAEYAEINLFVQLTVLQLPSGKRHTWTPQHKKTAPF